MNNQGVENSSFVVFRNHPLTEVEQRILTHLYTPLIGPKSIHIYLTLGTFLTSAETESMPSGHLKLFQMLQIKKETEFMEERNKLEAVGLLEVYQNQNIWVYKLKHVLMAEEFFQNEILSTFLYQNIGFDAYQALLCEFLVHRFDLKQFENVTKAFDEVFEIETGERLEYLEELSTLIRNTTGEQVQVKNPHFDYKYFHILMSALDILDAETLNSRSLYDLVNRYSFLYQLTTEEIKDAVVESVQIDKQLDEEKLKKACKRIYDGHIVKPKVVVKTMAQTDQDKLVSYLEQTAPTEIVKTMFGVGLVASEIEMFDTLMKNNQIDLGILNVLVIYVLQDKNGEVPSYNYFNKIVKSWQRMGITSTKEAMDHINGRTPVASSKQYRGKTVKDVPDWYDDYIKEVENKQNKQMKEEDKSDEETMEELNAFFQVEKRK